MTMKCAICGNEAGKYGNNPEPLLHHDERVCDDCNALHIIPIRLGMGQTITLADGRQVTIKPRRGKV